MNHNHLQPYSDILFSSNDAWGYHIYSFRINMISHEISIEYRNNQCGFTKNGINVSDKQFRHIENICLRAVKFFKSPTVTSGLIPDPNRWELKMIKNDGTPPSELKNDSTDNLFPPAFLDELVCLVMDLASFDNKGFKYF